MTFPRMTYQMLIVLCLHITMANTAPLILMPIPWMSLTPLTPQDMVLQEQLTQLQVMQRLNVQSPFKINKQPQPLVVLLQKPLNPNVNVNELLKVRKDNELKNAIQTNLENEEADQNSIIIDAAPEAIENESVHNQNQATFSQPQRAIILLPNGRLSIGEIISGIPWLPFEINVPDTISWAYNGIASGIGSIIAIIGSPFQGAAPESQVQEMGMKSLLKQMQMRKQNMMRPLVMISIDGSVLPIQV